MNIGGLLGGFAEGASDGVRTALDFVDRRERRAYQQEDMANKREDRKLAMEDRGRRLQDETKARELVDMQRTELTDKFNEGQRQKRLRDTVRTEVKTRFDQQNAARDAWGRGDDGDQPPPLRGTVAIYDDMLDNPPEEWRSDPEYGTAITALRTAAEKEGLGAMYSAWKRNATPLEMGKIFNRHGDHYAAQFKSGKDFSDEDIKAMGQDPADKKNILVAIDDKGRHLPMHMPSVGKFLGLEKESKWVKGPDNSGVVYDETDPRRHYTFPDQPKAPASEDGLKAKDAEFKYAKEYVDRANASLHKSFFVPGQVTLDETQGQKFLEASGLMQTWLANGITEPNGRPVVPERVAHFAREVIEGRIQQSEINDRFKFQEQYVYGGMPGAAPRQPAQSTAGQQNPGGLPQKALVVAGDTRPTTPPQGAPTDGNWRRTEQGWIYVSKDGANVWEGDGAPAAPAAAPAATPAPATPAPKPAAAAPAVDPVAQARTLDTQIAQLKSTLAGGGGMAPEARRSAQAKLAEMETARAKLGIGPAEMQQADKTRRAQELATAQDQLAKLEAAPKDYRNHSAMSALQDMRAKVAALKKAVTEDQAGGTTAPQTRGLSAPAAQRPTAGNDGVTGSWGQPEQPKPPTALDKAAPTGGAVAPAMEAPRNEFERAAASKPLKIPPPPGPKQAYTVMSSNGIEVYRFAETRDGTREVGYFIPDGKGVKFQRIKGDGSPSGNPVYADSKDAFIARLASRINLKGRK